MDLKNDVIKIISECRNIAEIIKKLGYSQGGSITNKIKNIIEESNLDTSHFIKNTKIYELKYNKINRICPKCSIKYETIEGGKKFRMFCSQKCANSKEWTIEDKNKKRLSALNSLKVKNANLNRKKKEVRNICQNCNIEYCNITGYSKFCTVECRSVWWSNHQKNLYKTGKNYVAGGTSKWIPYKNIKVQGTYELRTCYILDKMLENGEIDKWTYTNDRIPYIGIDGKSHTYLLDFKVECDNCFYYIETKGWKKDNDEFKWSAVKECGYELKVWYISDIKKLENKYKI